MTDLRELLCLGSLLDLWHPSADRSFHIPRLPSSALLRQQSSSDHYMNLNPSLQHVSFISCLHSLLSVKVSPEFKLSETGELPQLP